MIIAGRTVGRDTVGAVCFSFKRCVVLCRGFLILVTLVLLGPFGVLTVLGVPGPAGGQTVTALGVLMHSESISGLRVLPQQLCGNGADVPLVPSGR